MLKLIGAGTAGAVLAACAPRVVVAPPEEPAEPTEEPVEVEAEEPAEEAAEPTEAPAAEGKIDITLDFQGYGPGRDGSAGMALEALLSSYHELPPHVSVNHTPINPAAWDDIQAWTVQRLVAQDGPDLLFCNQPSLIERWMEAGLIGFWDPYLSAANSYVPRQPALGEPVHSTLRDAVEWHNGVALETFYNEGLLGRDGARATSDVTPMCEGSYGRHVVLVRSRALSWSTFTSHSAE
jgi:hypothetical protein